MNLARLLHRSAGAFPARPAVIEGTRTVLDYAGLSRRAAVLGGRLLADFGLAPGDRVALVMKNVPAYVEILFACWHAGLTAVPVNAKLHPREVAYILEHSGARACFATPGLHETVAPLADELAGLARVISVADPAYAALLDGPPVAMAETAADDVAWLFYTSGTTGRPKGAMLTHGNLMAMTLSYFADVDTVAPGDAIVHAAPMSHGSGIYILPHVAQAAAQVIPASGGFDEAEVFALIAAHPGTAMFGAPTMVKRLVEHPSARGADTSNLKTIVYGGGPMYLADLERAMALLGNKLVEIYGQGESPMTITAKSKALHADRGNRARLGSVGVAQTVVEVRIAGEDDETLAPGEAGEILVRGPSVMKGYWRDDEATAKTLRGGWLHTGDVGVMDADGFLTLTDRSKDVIISGGTNIYPREVEEVLLTYPDVVEVSVIGAPHPEWGETVFAFVVAGAGVDAAALDAHCRANIARFKRPKDYRFVDALPKNSYGKILKTELRKLLAER